MRETLEREGDGRVLKVRSPDAANDQPRQFMRYRATRKSRQNDNLIVPAESFSMDDKLVYTTFFHWFATGGGQLSGPWMPAEGRENWDGFPPWWQTQIKQVMMANIDVILVHLINNTEERRVTLFQGIEQLRREGYDVPRVAPFLDPLVTWGEQPPVDQLIDLATVEGKQELADQYIRFFNMWFEWNPDALADDYLAKIDGRLILDSWHFFRNFTNIDSLTRNDLESRIQTAMSQRFPVFDNGIYMITTGINPPFLSFLDEKVAQFEINEYFWELILTELRLCRLNPVTGIRM